MKEFDSSLIPPDELTPLVEMLLRVIQNQQEEIDKLKEEISKLKGQKGRPKIKPSSLEKAKRSRDGTKRNRNGEAPLGRRKVRKEERVIEPAHIPEGSRFKGYKTYTVQDLLIQATEITFKLKVYVTPEGQLVRGELPKGYSSGHFGPELLAHCLQLYHGGFMTQPAVLEYLREQGVDISAGQLHNILTENTEDFTQEMEATRQAGIEESSHLHADDTGARHQGENGVCTCVSGPLFCYFSSSKSKSRLNFLEILRGTHKDYILDEGALIYAFEHEITISSMDKLDSVLDEAGEKRFRSKKSWVRFLKKMKISGEKDVRILSEAAVLASAIHHGLPEGIPILTDAAPQFYLWTSHALCWIHEERHYRKLIPVSNHERDELDKIRGQIWDLYEELKAFSAAPSEDKRKELEAMFGKIFKRSGVTDGLDELLKNTYSRMKGLLQVLKHPHIPLHNNDCERDIRAYVKRRKISGTTRSAAGRRARDTFLSLQKTCLKLGISFFGYIRDRLCQLNEIPPLNEVLVELARAGP
ncbi:hypothetical protein SCG7086_AB_00100 [Chlamydiales bacterium SCGC AG-110-P3]|nr:hypothetical protein SCG7086_AB_00100 [Chlamydiales bacterium SCGC AG-110-P3]